MDTIFFSWQSDTPNKLNRQFIEECLKRATKEIQRELKLTEPLRDNTLIVDKDTKGIPGSPPIFDVILKKIDKCKVFVPDVTFIGTTENGRITPNPNVLIEYGYALKSISHSRIVTVMNTVYGEPSWDTLPFDLRHLRHPIKYSLPETHSAEEKRQVRNTLVSSLKDAINLIMELGDDEISSEIKGHSNELDALGRLFNPKKVFASFYDPQNLKKELYIPAGQKAFIHIIPSSVGIEIPSAKRAVELINNGNLGAFRIMENGPIRRNKYGAFTYQTNGNKISRLTQLLLNGEIWGVDNEVIELEELKSIGGVEFGYIPTSRIEHLFAQVIDSYIRFCRDTLEASPPIKFAVGLTNIEGYRLAIPRNIKRNRVGQYFGEFVRNHVIYEGIIKDYSGWSVSILRPFFNLIWDEAGEIRPDLEIIAK